MAFTNTLSNKQQHGFARITNAYTDVSFDYPLFLSDAVSSGIELSTNNAVTENAYYFLTVYFPEEYCFNEIELSINDSDPFSSTIENAQTEDINNKSYLRYPIIRSNTPKQIFLLIYGFVRIEITACTDQRKHSFTTKDIPCLTKAQKQTYSIEKMIEALLDDSENSVTNWMFIKSDDEDLPYSILNGGYRKQTQKSLSSVIQLVENIIRVYDQHFPYFNSHGYCKIKRISQKMPPRNIRKVGRKELLWISKNMDTLFEIPNKSSIDYGGHYYIPKEIESERKIKSFDNYENRIILGFLDEVILKIRYINSKLNESSKKTTQLKEQLSPLEHDDYSLPSLILIRQCFNRELAFTKKLNDLIIKLKKIKSRYISALPGVKKGFPKTVKRTKVFQEVISYSDLFNVILKWLSFGDFTQTRENLLLHTFKLDKLHEYYSLYRILDWLSNRGFSADEEILNPIKNATYTEKSKYYKNDERIATIYSLSRNLTKICLYYQPVIYGDEREENGITLHRLSPANPKSNRLFDSFWHPDFLISVCNGDDNKKWYIFDAKFSHPDKLWEGYPKEGRFVESLIKYKTHIAGRSVNDKVESVWLLAGRADSDYIRYIEDSSWAKNNFKGARSGIVSLTPRFSKLNNILNSILLDENIHEEISKSSYKPTTNELHKDMEKSATPSIKDREQREFIKSRNPYQKLILELYRIIDKKDYLYKSKWAEANLGLAHPVLRKIEPKGTERKYYKKGFIDSHSCYIYNHWLPIHENRLKSFIARYQDHT